MSVADQVFSADYVYHGSGGEPLRGPADVKRFAEMFRSAFPDLHLTIEEQIGEGDKVACRWTATGTHKGELMGIRPTGNRVRFAGIAIARFENGRILEIWENYDALGLMQQLGAIPSPEQMEKSDPS